MASQLSLALVASGRFWGLINVYSRQGPLKFAAHEIRLAETFAQQAAIALVNADPTAWDSLLTEQSLVPAPLIGSYEIPIFPTASVPSQAQWDDALAWARENELVSTEIAYGDSVTSAYLP